MKKELQELYDEIKHGDEEHQKWLYDKMEEFSKNMKVEKRQFYETSIGKVVLHGIHEHNAAIGLIRNEVRYLKRELGKLTPAEVLERLDAITVDTKRAVDSMDYIYEQIKKLEGY